VVIALLVWLGARRPLPATPERRFELSTLRRVWPLLGGYLLLSALWPVPWTAAAWHGGWGLAELRDMPGLVPMLRTLEYLAAFTLLGYTIAEARGRHDDPPVPLAIRVAALCLAAAVLLEACAASSRSPRERPRAAPRGAAGLYGGPDYPAAARRSCARSSRRASLEPGPRRRYTGGGGTCAMFTPKKTSAARRRGEDPHREREHRELKRELDRGGVQLLDIRDIRERQKLGWIPGSLHVPRGMLEFWLDPTSPYHNGRVDPEKRIVIYCAGGGTLGARHRRAARDGLPRRGQLRDRLQLLEGGGPAHRGRARRRAEGSGGHVDDTRRGEQGGIAQAMADERLAFLGLGEQARRIRAREISPVELTEAHLARIERLNPRLGAYITVCAEGARAAARAAEQAIARGARLGPLHGITVGVKDIFDTAGVRTTHGSSFYRDNVPVEDADSVRRLKAAGAIVIGKCNTHEFAAGSTTNNPWYGPRANPWNLDRSPGGSSGGSGAAVAAFLCAAATGTDTGGSIRALPPAAAWWGSSPPTDA
jgi:rhodanese-related sulfurtransferase